MVRQCASKNTIDITPQNNQPHPLNKEQQLSSLQRQNTKRSHLKKVRLNDNESLFVWIGGLKNDFRVWRSLNCLHVWMVLGLSEIRVLFVACAHCLIMVSFCLIERKPAPCHMTTHPKEHLKMVAPPSFCLGRQSEGVDVVDQKNFFNSFVKRPRICVWKAVFPPYVGSMVHL